MRSRATRAFHGELEELRRRKKEQDPLVVLLTCPSLAVFLKRCCHHAEEPILVLFVGYMSLADLGSRGCPVVSGCADVSLLIGQPLVSGSF